ncbi:hypothetical protein GTP45_11725 [Pseudoduganella sp. FT55W]|uniref:Uncharacterized protein n=1 Tax=Duganella rivi TaxID=2666083 RepID=A0A7X4GPY7_9BURK|nr:hypothetical protein [Duganella rivi]MYM67497.1 hypothetical protein [Duganella rivi]
MDYIFIVLGFVATLVATLGKTKDPAKSGLRALTPIGWFALLISASMVGITLYKTHQTASKAEADAVSARVAESIAGQALSASLRKSLGGINVLYRQCSTGSDFMRIESLKDDIFFKCLSGLNLNKPARDPAYVESTNPFLSIALTMNKASLAGREKFWKDLQSYEKYLNKDLMLKATEFYNLRIFNSFDNSQLVATFPNVPLYFLSKDDGTDVAITEMVNRAMELDTAFSNTLHDDKSK